MVWIVNPASKAIESTVSLDEIGVPASVRRLTITGADPTAVNSFEQKENVAPFEEAVRPRLTLRREFPAYSVTGMEFKMKAPR